MSDETTLDNPAPESIDTPPSDTLEGAAAALAGLMDDSGDMLDETPAKEDAPAEPLKAEEVKPAEPEMVEVDIDGFKVSLPKDKADKLSAERLMQADYTRKTMQAAEERKAAETERQTTINERQAAKQQLQAITTTLEAAVQSGQLRAPDPSLLDSDPVAYLRQQAQWSQAQTAFAQARQQLQNITTQEQHSAAAQRQQILESERAQLLAKVPEWKDEGKAQTEKAEFYGYLIQQGYTPEQVETTTDHRAMLAQLQAFRYTKLIADQKAVIAKKVPPATPKAVRPGAATDAPTNPINKAAMQRLKSPGGGKVQDAASAIASLLG